MKKEEYYTVLPCHDQMQILLVSFSFLGDEMFSDVYKIKCVDDVLYEVEGKVNSLEANVCTLFTEQLCRPRCVNVLMPAAHCIKGNVTVHKG